MERLDYFVPAEGGNRYLLNVQSSLLNHLSNRVVIPLFPLKEVRAPIQKLNPVFVLDGKDYVMRTQFISAVTLSELGKYAGNLAAHADDIINAIDMLFSGI